MIKNAKECSFISLLLHLPLVSLRVASDCRKEKRKEKRNELTREKERKERVRE